MDKQKLKLAIFDKDGLMMDTEAPVYHIWQEVFTERGLPIDEDFYRLFIGRSREDNIALMCEKLPDVDGEELYLACGAKVHDYLESNPIDTKPGLFELFDALDARGIKKVVATSSRRRNAEMTLKKCGILERVDGVVTGDMVERGKPAPDIFLKAAETMGFKPEECLVLEDSNAGVLAAHAAGIPVAVVPDMIDNPPEIVALCEARCDSLLDVIDLIS